MVHHSTLRAEHRVKGVSASTGCAINEVILMATSTVIPALSPGGYEGMACPLPVPPCMLLRTSSGRCDTLNCSILTGMKTF